MNWDPGEDGMGIKFFSRPYIGLIKSICEGGTKSFAGALIFWYV